MRITRRHLQLSLAALWLLDAVLQCQPFMFGRGFTRRILAPAAHGLPAVVAAPVHLATGLVSTHPQFANGAFVLIQLALGLGLLTRRYTRLALVASIAWALSIWVGGEGLGGITTGATLLSGAPGAAVLYAVIAVLAWPTHDPHGDERPSRLALPAWCLLWLTGAVLQLVAGNNSTMSFTMMVRSAQSGAPGWVGEIDRYVAGLQTPRWMVGAMIALDVLVAIWVLVPGWTRRFSLGAGTFIALTGWFLFQGLGDVTSGRATDPNSGPLIVLLALAVAGAYPRDIATPLSGHVVLAEPMAARELEESVR